MNPKIREKILRKLSNLYRTASSVLDTLDEDQDLSLEYLEMIAEQMAIIQGIVEDLRKTFADETSETR